MTINYEHESDTYHHFPFESYPNKGQRLAGTSHYGKTTSKTEYSSHGSHTRSNQTHDYKDTEAMMARSLSRSLQHTVESEGQSPPEPDAEVSSTSVEDTWEVEQPDQGAEGCAK
jgi:hypothetical protein